MENEDTLVGKDGKQRHKDTLIGRLPLLAALYGRSAAKSLKKIENEDTLVGRDGKQRHTHRQVALTSSFVWSECSKVFKKPGEHLLACEQDCPPCMHA
jgi:hypothetical protein